jgi:Ca2+/Na+ antiporter
MFPFAHLLALILGGIILFLLKRKYPKISSLELIIISILYVILVGLFTAPAQDFFRKLIGLIQLQ